MDWILVIPSAETPEREGLSMSVTRLPGVDGAERLELRSRSGAIRLELREEGTFVFTWGTGTLQATSEEEGERFVDAVAEWLGFELRGEEAAVASEALELFWARLGGGSDRFGEQWESYKLSLALGERYAEVFVRFSDDGTRAQLVEKWSEYRRDLLGILERVLRRAPPRVIHALVDTAPSGSGLVVGDRAGVQVSVPPTWRASVHPEGHWRLTNADDEMVIEVSCLRLPPLPPDAPDVAARLRVIIDASKHRDTASPITRVVREDVSMAWSEYRWDAKDTKDASRPRRPARGRWLIAANAWVQVLVTACWWSTDASAGEAAWSHVIASLGLGSRTSNDPAPEAEA